MIMYDWKKHTWHIDRVTEQWQNLEQVCIWLYDSVPDQEAVLYDSIAVWYFLLLYIVIALTGDYVGHSVSIIVW